MHTFDFAKIYDTLLTPEIVSLVGQIHEYKGRQALFIGAKPDALNALAEVARLQSIEASNRIEGICTSEQRLKKLVQDKTMPRTPSEQEIAGYRDVLAAIHENYDYIPPKAAMILQLHRDLYKFSGAFYGGHYKTGDNAPRQTGPEGPETAPFQPVSAHDTPEAMEQLCSAFEQAVQQNQMDPLLLIPVFVLDFLCIHPFDDGNGPMSRLLTLLLLCRQGYMVGKYVSIEKGMEQSRQAYCEALRQSFARWQEGENDYRPFVQYTLEVVAAAYRDFSARVRVFAAGGTGKPDRIREIIRNHPGAITKAELMAQCPDISLATVQRTLAELQKNDEIIKLGGGRYTAYTWNHDKE